MIYDAVLAARRGLGVEELRLARGDFREAVDWALFAERAAPELLELRDAAATDPPDSLVGQPRIDFMSRRTAMRERLKAAEALLFPGDGEVSDA